MSVGVLDTKDRREMRVVGWAGQARLLMLMEVVYQ